MVIDKIRKQYSIYNDKQIIFIMLKNNNVIKPTNNKLKQCF